MSSLEKTYSEYKARMAVGRKCMICSVPIMKGDPIMISQRSDNHFHQDCFEVVEKHQSKASIVQKLNLSQDKIDEINSGKLIQDEEVTGRR